MEVVSGSDFIDPLTLKNYCGVGGTLFNAQTDWLKFYVGQNASCNRKGTSYLLYVSMLSIVNNISGDMLVSAGVREGTKYTHNSMEYSVRLIYGFHPDRINTVASCQNNVGESSEWNELMYRVCSVTPTCSDENLGTILSSRRKYEANWGKTDFYRPLVRYKPASMLGHRDSVFLVSDKDDIDLAGGDTEWIFIVEPLGRVDRHDLNWSSKIALLISNGLPINHIKVRRAALNYWSGKPHPD